MKNHKVTADLLQRYHLGLCSEDEKRVVIEWLLDTADESLEFNSSDEEAPDMEIWENIEKNRKATEKTKKLPLVFRYARWSTAACFLLIAGLATHVADGMQVNIDNMKGEQTKTMTHNGLVFRLAPKSSLEAQRSFWGSGGNIRFCGTMEIINETGRDIELVFNSICKKSDYTIKKVVCRKGSSYIALHHFLTQDEIIIMNSKWGEQHLPGAVAI